MTKLLVANWKMNLSKEESLALTKRIFKFLKEENNIEAAVSISIAPSAPIISEIGNIISGSNIKLAAQDCSTKDNGTYTGETSAKILKECGCQYVILGHSERRRYQLETSEIILEKTTLAYKYGLTPIICIGEAADERSQNATMNVLSQQLKPLLSLDYTDKELIIAYEPVWAIGSGKIPTKEQIQEVILYIKRIIQSESPTANKNLKILYGGSVTPENCQKLLYISGIGGLLIGGASLIYDKFIRILKATLEKEKPLA